MRVKSKEKNFKVILSAKAPAETFLQPPAARLFISAMRGYSADILLALGSARVPQAPAGLSLIM